MGTVAIVGRPNVGKSTLFNRLLGRRAAIVDNQPGVTRDRLYGAGQLADLAFALIDTPGLDTSGEGELAEPMRQQSQEAFREAAVILLVIDAKAGLNASDEAIARQLHHSGRPVIVVANKAESYRKVEAQVLEVYQLGFAHVIPVSAEHGDGMAALYEALAAFLPKSTEGGPDLGPEGTPAVTAKAGDAATEADEEALARPMRLAIMGRPNVGKSTLLNHLLGQQRVLTGAEAGVTRDSIHVSWAWQGQPITLIDTAGMRRKARIDTRLEQYAVAASLEALTYSDLAVLMLDATAPLEKQDNVLASLIEREGRGCVIALNKADLVTIDANYRADLARRLEHVMPHMRGVPVVPLVAETGQGREALLREVVGIHRLWNRHLPTAQLNSWLHAATAQHAPPVLHGRRLKLRYITQAKTRPPSFVIFANRSKDIPEAYRRYLINSLRAAFALPGVPLRLWFRTGANPYAP